jgi:hypothetical protein
VKEFDRRYLSWWVVERGGRLMSGGLPLRGIWLKGGDICVLENGTFNHCCQLGVDSQSRLVPVYQPFEGEDERFVR